MSEALLRAFGASHRGDGLSGATITSNGVSRAMAFWFSGQGYGPYLTRFREGKAT